MDYPSLGARVRRERVLRGWTQEQLAEKADISLSFLGHIERGTRKASLETMVVLCNVLDVSMDSLLSESLARRSRRFRPEGMPPRKQTAIQEILRTVEEAVAAWAEED